MKNLFCVFVCAFLCLYSTLSAQQIELTLVPKIETGSQAFNGSVEAFATGGSGSYEYLWSNGETTSSIEDLTTGIYCVTVYDTDEYEVDCVYLFAFDCIMEVDIVLTQPDCENTFFGTAELNIVNAPAGARIIWQHDLAGSLNKTFVDNIPPSTEEWSIFITDELRQCTEQYFFSTYCLDETYCRPSDSLELIKLYEALDGNNWTNKWDFKVPMTEWYGVQLNPKGCVERIDLSNNNLQGDIPSSFYTPELVSLDLSYNKISDNIPPELGDLCELETINLSNNDMISGLPPEISQLEHLEFIDCSNNDLDGEYPSEYLALCPIIFKDFKVNPELSEFAMFCINGSGAQICPALTNGIFCIDTLGTLASELVCGVRLNDSSIIDEAEMGWTKYNGIDLPYLKLVGFDQWDEPFEEITLFGCSGLTVEICEITAGVFASKNDLLNLSQYNNLDLSPVWFCGEELSECFSDNDNDGFNSEVDCDDNNPNINPEATEICDGIDNDCNGDTDEGLSVVEYFADNDMDGFGDPNSSISDCQQPNGMVTNSDDCNDNDANINPDQDEAIYNGIDDDCNPNTLDDDLDQDGFEMENDCDDNNPDVNPNQSEIPYNEQDDDCDPSTLDDDLDQDGFGIQGDCDDNNPDVNPNTIEVCDGIDNNCDGDIDEGLLNTYFVDADMDGFGDPLNQIEDCEQPSNAVTNNLDCDDQNASINPDAEEIPNNDIDEDCDGIDGTTSLNDISHLSSMKVSPNPTAGIINIEIENSGDLVDLLIYNFNGQRILTQSNFINKSSIDLSDLKDGFYMISIHKDNVLVGTTKFIKHSY